ncbi:MAG: MFS transporter [Chloroflexales bacterium]|nr:MFS transporter [Chloroflexales bacterium]
MQHDLDKTPQDEPSYNRREQISWYFYDFANSAYTTTVVTVFLGPYLTRLVEAVADAENKIYPLGIPVVAGAFFPYLVSLSVLLQIFFLPIMGAIADYSHRKKQLLGISAYIGAIATMGLYFVQGHNYMLGGALFIIANLAFGTSIVFYNAFLPEIASPEQRDAVSSQGWALGYLGGGLMLAANLALFNSAEALGLTRGHAIRISMTAAGMWWAIFTLIPLAKLKQRQAIKRLPPGERFLTIGFKQLAETFRKVRFSPQTLLFLGAYLLYNDGIQAVISLSSVYGSAELGMSETVLVSAILMVQFVAFGGALVFGYLARFTGAKRAILMSLAVWIGVITLAYFVPKERPVQFFIMAGLIGIVLGGSQALSRSVFSLMIPVGREAEYFSLYEMSERGTSWLAPLFFGLVFQFTNSYRLAIISLIIFFVAGFVLLFFVNVHQATIEAGNEPPTRV